MYKKMRTKNGLSILASPMDHMTSVSLSVWVGVGGRHESKKESGISHLLEHMLFKGTFSRTAKELKEAVEGVGGAFNGFTSDEVTCYMVKVPSDYMELGLDVLADMVQNARISEEDLEKEKFVVLEEIKMYRDLPGDYVLDLLSEIMWPDNALGRPLTGTVASVNSLTRDELVDFRNTNYNPTNIAVVAAGRIDSKKFFASAEKKFQAAKKGKAASFENAKVTQRTPRVRICREKTKQTHLAFGFHAEDKNIKERFAMKLANVVFGGNMSSRLFEELREKYGLCYDISSSYKRHSDKGEIHIHAGVDTGKALQSAVAILDETKKLKSLGVTVDELARAKKYIKGQFLLAMESTSSRMMWLGDRLLIHKRIPEVKEVLENIDAVTAEDIKKVVEKVFKPNLCNLAIVGKFTEKERNKIKKEISLL
ncbi:MAG: insulinase family protein [Candidatus Omnitrophica bacterium]|nr:insulinase family protein [Candidatus Omnitrophota bacterium]